MPEKGICSPMEHLGIAAAQEFSIYLNSNEVCHAEFRSSCTYLHTSIDLRQIAYVEAPTFVGCARRDNVRRRVT